MQPRWPDDFPRLNIGQRGKERGIERGAWLPACLAHPHPSPGLSPSARTQSFDASPDLCSRPEVVKAMGRVSLTSAQCCTSASDREAHWFREIALNLTARLQRESGLCASDKLK